MAEIPSDIASSAAQAPFQARQVSSEREGRQTSAASSANRQIKAADEAGDTVETTDADNRVFADAEGAGSQGRSLEEDALPAEPEKNKQDTTEGITKDEDGHLHLDLEA